MPHLWHDNLMAHSSAISSKALPLKGLILAGGTGSRLRPITYALAKQLVPVANRPILWYALDALVSAGIQEIAVIISPETGYQIRAAVNRWQAEQLNRQPQTAGNTHVAFITQDAPLGLAHAVKTAQTFMANSPFLMYLGDNLINADLATWTDGFLASKNEAAILLKPVDNPSSFGVAVRDNAGQVTDLVEKPTNPPSDLALIGVYLFRPSIFTAINNIQPSPRGELEITDAIQWLIGNGRHVSSAIYEDWWLDTGKKDDLLAANTTVLDSLAISSPPPPVSQEHRMTAEFTGPVWLGENVTLNNCRITGPASIGHGCVLDDVTIGPYSSVGPECKLTQAAIEHSVLLDGCDVRGVAMRDSLLGHRCQLTNDTVTQHPAKPPVMTLSLADDSKISVG